MSETMTLERPGRLESPPVDGDGSPMTGADPHAKDALAGVNFTGINIGANQVTPGTEHLPDDQKTAVRWLHWHAREQGWTWDQLIRAVGYSTTTWARIFRGAYVYAKGDPKAGEHMPIDDHVARINKYRAAWEEEQERKASGFVETSVWQRVEWLCSRAYKRQKIGFIWGDSQIGKSSCALEFQRRNNHGQTCYCEMPPASGVQLMLKTIADALTVPSTRGFDALLKDVCQALDGSRLLIIDEIQRVFTTYQKHSVMRCLDTLRYIHDHTKCGMVLVGTNVMRDQLRRGEFALYLQQLARRGRTLMLQLPTEPPRADLDLMSQSFGLESATGEAEQVLTQVAKADGFGAVKMLLQDAHERATKKRRAIAWSDFVWAHGLAKRMSELEAQ